MTRRVELTTMGALLPRYEGVLLDSFGVLVHSGGLLDGAAPLIAHLTRTKMPWLVLTNDASRLPERLSAWYATLGLDIGPERILTSGAMIAPFFRQHGLAGARCVVLGPPDSLAYVERAGGHIVDLGWDTDAEVLAVCDDHGFELLESLDRAVTMLFRRRDAGRRTWLLLPNPDLLYPRGESRYGFTSGAIAMLLEAALERRYAEADGRRFERLGKPFAPIFSEALGRLGTSRALMVGDQLETDIRGAVGLGMDAALLLRGLGRVAVDDLDPTLRPTFVLQSIDPGAAAPCEAAPDQP